MSVHAKSVQPLLHNQPMWLTRTDAQTTERATRVAIGRIYAMHAMRPKSYSL